MACNTTSIKIQPSNVSWEIEEAWCVDTVADVAGSLQSKWFKLGKAGQSTYSHYVWLNLGGLGVDPAPAGLTAIPVTGALNVTAATLASAISTAVDATSDFESVVSGNHITIYTAVAGESAGLLDGTAATGFTFTQAADGGSMDLGLLDGDIELSMEETLLAVTAHQTGSNLIAELRQGFTCEVALVMKEADLAKYKEIFGAAGGADTVSGGTEVFGWGINKQGTNTIVQARRLIMHPVANAANDYSEDFCAWKAYPMPESIVYSGENPKTLSITFKCYLDSEKPDAIQLFCMKDWTQYVPITP